MIAIIVPPLPAVLAALQSTPLTRATPAPSRPAQLAKACARRWYHRVTGPASLSRVPSEHRYYGRTNASRVHVSAEPAVCQNICSTHPDWWQARLKCECLSIWMDGPGMGRASKDPFHVFYTSTIRMFFLRPEPCPTVVNSVVPYCLAPVRPTQLTTQDA